MSPKTKLRAATVGGTADDVEAAFYEALQRGDIDALMNCWADEDEIFCVHPGGPRLMGAEAIRTAFERMFGHGGTIQAIPARVRRVESLASAVHSVIERIEVLTPEGRRHAFVLATNVYHKTPQGWRMVAHHTSPGSTQDPGDAQEAPRILH
jgi:ketosteroid isomerase-like protein